MVYQVLNSEYADRGEDEVEAWCHKQTYIPIATKGLQTNEDGRGILAKAISTAIQRASLKIGRGLIKFAALRVLLRTL